METFGSSSCSLLAYVVFQHMTEAVSYVACLGYDCLSTLLIKLQFNTVYGLDHNDATFNKYVLSVCIQ